MKKIYFLIVITILISLKINAQTPGLVTQTSNVPNLICTNMSSFVIDYTGNKWMGFNNGNVKNPQLMRFNGSVWDTFPHIPGKKVNALAVDFANNIWVGGNMGLTSFNGTTYTTYDKSNSNIISDTIVSLAYGNGNIYLGTNHGLSVFNGSTFTNYNRATNGMKSDSVYCITVESASTIWLGNNYGLDKFNGSNFSFYSVLNGANAKVTCVYIDPLNIKWIGTFANGSIRYDNTTFTPVLDFIGGWPTLLELTCGTVGGVNYPAPNPVYSICKGPMGGVYMNNMGFNFAFEVFNNKNIISYNTSNIYNSILGNFNQYENTTNSMYSAKEGTFSVSLVYIDTTINKGSLPRGCQTICGNSSCQLLLDINNVCAIILDNADAHWNYTSNVAGYSVPKQKNNKPLFASSFWMGGYNGNSLHTAAMTYRQSGFDFWPGPLDTTNAAANDTSMPFPYDHIWKINRYDIANYIYNWNLGNVQNGSYIPPSDFLTWPGQGTGNFTRKLAPYVDVNHNGIYDPIHDGDYPDIKGDQMLWHVFNDNYTTHGETQGLPFGVEVHASAYAFVCPNIADSNLVLNNTTFYNYKIYNRSQNTYTNTYVSAWMDTDLGNYQDDYIGSDVMNNFGYVYNGDNYDEDNGGTIGYHDKLPAFACNILNGPLADVNDGVDNNNNGVIDEANEKCLQGGLSTFNNTSSSLDGNPGTFNGTGAMGYYNLMRNYWESGNTHTTYGNLGLNTVSATSPAYKFLFPGNSDPYGIGFGGSIANPVAAPINYGTTGWVEGTIAGNNPGDRRFINNIGPFTMQPGGVYEIDWALVFSQDTANCIGNNTCILPRMVQDNKRVKKWFDNNSFPSCLSLLGVGIKQNNSKQIDFNLYPNPANDNVYLDFGTPQKNITIEVFDMLGKLVYGFQYNDENKYVVMPVTNLQTGIYIVKVKTNEGYSFKKFIKE